MILFGVERLMKYKLKTRLFAALALSGVSFYWPASEVLAQEDDFGFIRPAEPTRQNDQELTVPPITQALPPIVSGASNPGLLTPIASANTVKPRIVVQAPNAHAKASAPVPFAASQVYNGAYVESEAGNVGHAQHLLSSQSEQQATTKQVAYNEPSGYTDQAPIGSGIQAQRDVPPIVVVTQSAQIRVPQIIQPIEQNELPPILSSDQAASDPAVPPVLTPKAGLDRLLRPIPAQVNDVVDGGMIQDEFLVDTETAEVKSTAAYGASPLLVQDAPPIVSGAELGALPSTDGVLEPFDPAVELPSVLGETFPRATPLDLTDGAARSVINSGEFISPATQPRPTFFDTAAQQPPAFVDGAAGCSTCGTPGGIGDAGSISGCSSCGENGCFDQAAVDAMFNSSGSNAYARRYLVAEALYLGRSDGDIFNSNRGSLSDFDFEAGARITVGRREDSTSGREFSYTGTDKIAQTIDTTDAGGNIQSLLVPTGGLSVNDIPSFFNATEQSQSKESYFHSLEFNKVKWGWDVIKSYVGLRYIFFDDEHTLFSQNIANIGPDGSLDLPQSGRYQIGTTNNLIGPHVGGELYYDVGYRVSLSGFSRLGAYINFSELNETLDNNGVRLIDEEDTNATFAYSYEIGLSAKYRLTRQSQFRLGYNLYFWDRLATVSDNIVNQGFGIPVGPSFFGAGTSDSDSVFLSGLSVGFEFYR